MSVGRGAENTLLQNESAVSMETSKQQKKPRVRPTRGKTRGTNSFVGAILGQHRTIPALRQAPLRRLRQHLRCPKCSDNVNLRYRASRQSPSATAAWLRFRCFRHWRLCGIGIFFGICRTSLAVSALEIMR